MAFQITYPAKAGGQLTSDNTGFGSIVVWGSDDPDAISNTILAFVGVPGEEIAIHFRNVYDEKRLEAMLTKVSARLVSEDREGKLAVLSKAFLRDVIAAAYCEEITFFSVEGVGAFKEASRKKFGHEMVADLLKTVPRVGFIENESIQVYFRSADLRPIVKQALERDSD